MEFNPNNRVIQLCIQGIHMEETGKLEEAGKLFRQAWDQATNDFEMFTAAWFIARLQPQASDKLKWYKSALQLALNINNEAVKAAFPSIYFDIAKCYEEMDDFGHAKKHHMLALTSVSQPADNGPFYHGTRADLQVGDLLTAGRESNYQPELVMNHIYFTALISGAGLAAALAKGDGLERVYTVEPTGSFEDDPNVTNKKFPGNPTRSYRTEKPLKIIGEVTDWVRQTPEQLQQWRTKLANNNGEIIN
jgi:tetratricopeptide (TPR) repeat protein